MHPQTLKLLLTCILFNPHGIQQPLVPRVPACTSDKKVLPTKQIQTKTVKHRQMQIQRHLQKEEGFIQ